MKIFFRLIFLLNIVLIGLTIVSLLASFVSPLTFDVPHLVSLFLPWFWVINLILVLFWLFVRDKRWKWSFLCVIVSIPWITRFVGFHFNQKEQSDQINVITFNSKSIFDDNPIRQYVNNWEQRLSCNIFCFQEVSENHLTDIQRSLPDYNAYFNYGKLILTKFPISNRGQIRFDKSLIGCIWADIHIGGRSYRVYNIHLQSNQVSREAESIMHDVGVQNNRLLDRMKGMFLNYRESAKIRVRQARTLIEHISEAPYPVIICGDLNDTPFSYTYAIFSNHLKDHFKVKGLGIGTTYAGIIPGLKIDYIFTDENFSVTEHRILREELSDHFPVLSRMKLKT
jgi:endonuclease/exonuclease/phosphatase family metal-dependent hydrolase